MQRLLLAGADPRDRPEPGVPAPSPGKGFKGDGLGRLRQTLKYQSQAFAPSHEIIKRALAPEFETATLSGCPRFWNCDSNPPSRILEQPRQTVVSNFGTTALNGCPGFWNCKSNPLSRILERPPRTAVPNFGTPLPKIWKRRFRNLEQA